MFVYNEPANPVGLCRYHDWVMSAKQIKTKKCLHKENNGNWCTHFVAFEGDTFWKTRRVKGKLKKRKGGNAYGQRQVFKSSHEGDGKAVSEGREARRNVQKGS